ncbi:MAG: SDR family oxidoreductase [Anaerolineaceae bacterium]|nr:SDR family oxidoreductase [Anaerolineaceae bacterium]
MADLEGRVIVVTGGARGLGAAICQTLSEAGADVVLADLRQEQARATAGEIGRRASAYGLDVTDEKQVQHALESVFEARGRLDGVINNAGIDVTLPIEELSVDQWDSVLAVNLRGPFLVAKYAFPLLKRQGGGHIVNIVSTAALRAWANASAYHASKWGLLGLSHALHVEGRPHGIKVTAVIAGGMRTPFLMDRFPDIDPDLLQDPRNVAETVRHVLTVPRESVIPEVMVLPMRETSWP